MIEWVPADQRPKAKPGYTYRSAATTTRLNNGNREYGRWVTYRRKQTWRQERDLLTLHNKLRKANLAALRADLPPWLR